MAPKAPNNSPAGKKSSSKSFASFGRAVFKTAAVAGIINVGTSLIPGVSASDISDGSNAVEVCNDVVESTGYLDDCGSLDDGTCQELRDQFRDATMQNCLTGEVGIAFECNTENGQQKCKTVE